MRHILHRSTRRPALIATVVVAGGIGALGFAGSAPSALTRAFEFPVSLGSAVTGNLTRPQDAVSPLTFAQGSVAVGALPVPLPQSLARVRQLRNRSTFFLPATARTPHARLLLSGVVDASGAPVSNTGNQLLIDAAVSPDGAATAMPPFVIPFDITNGMAYVDAALPIQTQSDAAVDVQVNGISVSDPNGQVFGVLGFRLAPRAVTPTPGVTSTPGGTPSPQPGQCFVGPDCMGPSFAASEDLCCHFTRPGLAAALATSWCPPDRFDPQTGQCVSNACVACGSQAPTPTQGPNACGNASACSGSCMGTCPDGSVAEGECQPAVFNGPIVLPGSTPIPPIDLCQCVPNCPPPPSPPPGVCGAGNSCQGTCTAACADGTTEIGQCVGVGPVSPLGAATCSCVVPCNQPPTPAPQCAAVPCGGQCVIVPPCPPGGACPDVVLQGECRDDGSGACQCVPSSKPTETPAPLCTADADCDDGDACTSDHCVNGTCEHACICLTAAGAPACCPGPAALCARSCGTDASGVCGGTCPSGATCESRPTAQASCGCVSDVGGPCGGNILAPPPVCAPGLVCQQSLPDVTGVCVKPTCIPLSAAGCSQTSDCCQPCGSGTRAPCAVCDQGTCVATP